MYNSRKKIIITIVVIFLIIILAIAGLLVYITTDIFKSNQVLFYKYMAQTFENIKYVENTQLSEIENLKKQKPYTIEGTLSFDAGEENTDINANMLSRMNLNIESKVNKPEEKAYTKVNLAHNNEDLFRVEYANSNNIYALKSDEIVSNFLGIENENLKVLAQKLGISDTSMIPNSIEPININEILSITEEEKDHITETYLLALSQNINKENFSKEKNIAVTKENVTYNATGYRLNLNEEELKQIQIALLQTLKEDSITLNILTTKAKLLGLNEEYTQVNNLTKIIEKRINTINSQNYIQDAGISIIVYVDKQEVILSEIIFKNEVKYTFYGSLGQNTRKNYLLIENLNTTSEYNKVEIELNETKDNIESTYNLLINIDDNIGIDVYVNNKGLANENNLITTCNININEGELTTSINYEQEMNFEEELDIIELSRSNCGVLNDYTTEQLQQIIQAVGERTLQVIYNKLQLVGANNIFNNMLELFIFMAAQDAIGNSSFLQT